jgi:excisionase family DNA binding protein
VIALVLERVDAAHLLAAVRAYRGHVSSAPAGLARLENVLRREVEGNRNGQQGTGTDAASEVAPLTGYGHNNLHVSLLTVPEVAERLHVSIQTVRRRIATGELPVVRLGGGPQAPVRVDPDELEEWLHGRKPPAAGASESQRSPKE